MPGISEKHMLELVDRMQRSGFQMREMIEAIGLDWKDVEDCIRNNAAKETRRGQLLLNFLMLRASIGFMAAKGERLSADGGGGTWTATATQN